MIFNNILNLIKKNSEFVNWINKLSLVDTDNFVENLYSAIFQKIEYAPLVTNKNLKDFHKGIMYAARQTTVNVLDRRILKLR